MDPDKDLVLDRILERTPASALASLNAVIDVEQRLRDLYREVGLDPELARSERPSAFSMVYEAEV
ncbi:hypothetical protein AB0J86_10095 [Micromonospora sp. NPDC049559]|uniref:hypothetical protein n=1 Tax=Micromonospora sp. NPDC049559 TaxID=3155923 RepID=UPI0034196D9E